MSLGAFSQASQPDGCMAALGTRTYKKGQSCITRSCCLRQSGTLLFITGCFPLYERKTTCDKESGNHAAAGNERSPYASAQVIAAIS